MPFEPSRANLSPLSLDLQTLAGLALFGDPQLCFEQVYRIAADHNIEGSGLNDTMHVAIQKGQLVWSKRELHRFGLPGRKSHAAESTQFLHRAGDRTDFVANVELHDFI